MEVATNAGMNVSLFWLTLVLFNVLPPDSRIDYLYKNGSLPFYKTYPPSAGLAAFVREFQVYHADWEQEKDLPAPFITCLANTEQNLYFYINDAVRLVTAQRQEIPIPPAIVGALPGSAYYRAFPLCSVEEYTYHRQTRSFPANNRHIRSQPQPHVSGAGIAVCGIGHLQREYLDPGAAAGAYRRCAGLCHQEGRGLPGSGLRLGIQGL